jgi:hypothetical protein
MFVVLFLAVALLAGFILWRVTSSGKRVREDSFFVGGESAYAAPNFPATEFYKTIEDIPLLAKVYKFLKSGKWDIYNLLNSLLNGLYFIFSLKWVFKRKR